MSFLTTITDVYNTQSRFSAKKQSWKCWHFCTAADGNKLQTIKNLISLKLSSHLSWCELTDFSIHLIYKFKKHKNANIDNLVYYWKTRVQRNHPRPLLDFLFQIYDESLSGRDVTIEMKPGVWLGGLYYDPIPGDFLRTVEETPQVCSVLVTAVGFIHTER